MVSRALRICRPVAFLLLIMGIADGDGNVLQVACAKEPSQMFVFIGTYTSGNSEGIYVSRLNLETGTLAPAELVAKTANPSFLALHPSRPLLYAVNEIDDFGGEKAGAVSAFALDPQSGRLTFLNQQSSRGGAPCHLVIDKAGRSVLVANYTGGSVAVLPIAGDGRLGPASSFVQHAGSSVNPRRQEAPHAHSINLDAANRFAVVADLGLDKVLVYRFDPRNRTLTPNEPPSTSVAPGAGPRHFAFHPGGQWAYVINELDSTLTAFTYGPERGVLKKRQTVSTLPSGFDGQSTTAEVQVHPSGRFLYGSNRGHDSLAMFSIDDRTGELQPLGHQSTLGKTPRNFGIDPTGRYLLAANQATDTIVIFAIDSETGTLSPTGSALDVPSPVCVKMMVAAP